ncbi:MAG: type II toxin-antitoxin system RelE/ParE family toxin [Alphaproteobacteria bacterium]|nr:type II toxin-antitoxin system RelE/ParE family toxin [Alphaproteobacteria bacterium]MBU1526630.1 type II toxin-antitoxin system RelE/ParE family toxin [Alphaproteobacteria bacterium]MBU2351229.1 type II toxin-antitoxin system RelE/ParE family toxin [Alphaproteobacteria bacterium]MBU2381474.1 type II toxin-antitoxin system RelE/ParE family toxin [Alphaproteobacteria bacterium]
MSGSPPIIQRTSRFVAWREGLRDRRAAIAIDRRIDRLGRGLMGDVKSVGGEVSELRVDLGPGYRLYFTRRGSRIIILLCGGDKSSQTRDIALAQELAELEL